MIDTNSNKYLVYIIKGKLAMVKKDLSADISRANDLPPIQKISTLSASLAKRQSNTGGPHSSR